MCRCKQKTSFDSLLSFVCSCSRYSLGYLAIKQTTKKQNLNHKSIGVVCCRKRAEKTEVGQKAKMEGNATELHRAGVTLL